ncbi:peptidase [Blastococcus sp. TBT05-19]|uniref:matrixin family metalloprotease n=1 Tax=Blastococcus sp. TBT05-19 TaxID=2250581 RepID=UPI000DEA159E|nr:matrixin family metalloprotease [Blastococcus sp. TBT05-19]RBY92264.1 peptidase [Blastococcus sp. TBT05-19]
MHPHDPEDAGHLPASPSGRVPQWVLQEAAGVTAPPEPWRGAVAPPRRRRGLWSGLLVAAAVAGAVALVDPSELPWAQRLPQASPGLPASSEPARPTDRPTPSGLLVPLGPPPLPPPVGGTHGFTTFQDDGVTPVAYDPCRTIHYVLRPDATPPGGEQLVHDAVLRIADVTGLVFTFDGYTDEPLTTERAVYQPERYGDQWAPVLIGWQTEAENPALVGDVVGEAGSVAVSLGEGPRVFVSGTVSLDSVQFPEILGGRDGAAVARGIVLHELGHLVGLAHVDDDAELMYPEARRAVTDFSAGDLTGLAALGAGPCVPEL